ncbi:hypothetical protein D9611_002185 [Ephemerocybe angulata]|uniref:Uncharacterized protein n=2 Tax=Ephemerocybe angulata TaxID=980116 RepID=A0A8H5C269_9AGAR|nr:hypothetical protein D9611_002185 [Tulosesus angulatus]KAF6762732.1 hypothetical protein DFP72DRAFT_876779 [Tulosesus angulatus]
MSALEKEISPRVNSEMLPKWIGKTVRLTCKLLNFDSESERSFRVEASDGGQVVIQAINTGEPFRPDDIYLEVIGKVIDATTISMLGCIGMGNELDMKLVNDTVILIHDPRFFGKMFSY